MNNRMKIITSMLLVIIGLSACAGMPAGVQIQDENNMPIQGKQDSQSTAPASPTEDPLAIELLFGEDSNPGESDATSSVSGGLTYPIVDTNQANCYNDSSGISCPNEGGVFYGQDAQYTGNAPRYQDNGDGTVTDLVTGLMWQQDPGEKMTYDQAVAGASPVHTDAEVLP